MPKAIWKGHVSFGLVTIPVALYPAEDSQATLHFKQLDDRDNAPVHMKRVNENTGQEVPWEHVVKGYPHGEGAWVVLSDDELAAANPAASQTIDVVGTVCADDVDLVYYEKPYFAEPATSGRKAYALLRDALREMGRAAVVRVVIRTRQHVGLLVPRGQALVLELVRYAHELRDPSFLDLPPLDPAEAGVTEAELKMARMLLDSIATTWDPTAYHDAYHDDVLALIARKAETGEVATAPAPAEEPAGGQVVDIMALLRASVERAAEAGSAGADGEPRAGHAASGA